MTDKASGEKPLTRSERINIRISTTQTILAVVGIFIGSIALYAALSESEAVRKQTEASVWPRVDVVAMYYGAVGEERIDIVARNRGIGPAIIKSVRVSVDDAPATSWSDVIRTVSTGEAFAISNQNIDRAVISPNEDIVMLSLEEQYASKELTRAVRDAFTNEQLTVEICYCSVFDSCWKTRSRHMVSKEVKACEAGERTEF